MLHANLGEWRMVLEGWSCLLKFGPCHFPKFPVQQKKFGLFVCLGLTSLLNIWGHITTVPACSSGTLTNMLPHKNAMPQTQDMTQHPVTLLSIDVECHTGKKDICKYYNVPLNNLQTFQPILIYL